MRHVELNFGIFAKHGIDNLLFLPDNIPNSLVIRLHGLPGRPPIAEENTLARLLTDIGIAFFAFDFSGIRASKGYYTYRNAFNLAKDILEYFAVDHDEIYPKIGFYAESFGGSIALSLANASSLISALFLWSPVLNFDVLAKEINMTLVGKFMEDTGVIRLPHYDNFSEAFKIQMEINPPENAQSVFEKIPAKILCSKSDLLFHPSLIQKELDPQFHHLIHEKGNLDHNLMKDQSALRVAKEAQDFFHHNLVKKTLE